MRKSNLFTLALVMVVGTTMGQQRSYVQKVDRSHFYIETPRHWFVKAGLGYSVAAQRQQLAIAGIANADGVTPHVINSQPRRASLSEGLQGIVGIGYMFNKSVGVCMNVNIGMLSKKYTYEATGDLAAPYGTSLTQSQQAKMPVLLTPSFYFQTTNKEFNLYSRVGLALPVYQNIKIESQTVDANSSTVYTGKMDMKAGFFPGLNGAIGIDYKINDQLHFWSELSMLSLSLYANESTITSYTVNGVEQLNSIPQNKRTTSYQDKGNSQTSTYQSKYTIPFSNAGISAGIAYRF